MSATNISALVGKRVVVRTKNGEEPGIARYVRIGGDEEWLVVDLDSRPGIGVGIHPDHVIGPEPGHASLWVTSRSNCPFCLAGTPGRHPDRGGTHEAPGTGS